jgi:hypothetical protein
MFQFSPINEDTPHEPPNNTRTRVQRIGQSQLWQMLCVLWKRAINSSNDPNLSEYSTNGIITLRASEH